MIFNNGNVGLNQKLNNKKMNSKNLKISIVLLLLFFSLSSISSQEISGKAYYQSATDVRVSDFEGRNMSMQQKQQFRQMMKDFFKKNYVLSFTKSESFYEEDNRLAHPMADNRIGSKLGHFVKGPEYKNVITNEYLQTQEFLGKLFLIKDPLQKLDWKITSESIKIGEYTCYKATAKKKVQGEDWRSITKANKDEKNSNIKEIEITAWFTIDIPVSQGPSDFWGLPGLILKVDSDRTSIICTKIIIDSSKTINIKKPTKGEVVSANKYHEITKRRLEELKNRGRERRNRKS